MSPAFHFSSTLTVSTTLFLHTSHPRAQHYGRMFTRLITAHGNNDGGHHACDVINVTIVERHCRESLCLGDMIRIYFRQ